MTKVAVTDHAVLRYLERVGGFEIDRLRDEIARRVERTYVPGAPAVIIDGFRFVIMTPPEGPVVVTVIDRESLTVVGKGRR